jgi:hypothetical protein
VELKEKVLFSIGDYYRPYSKRPPHYIVQGHLITRYMYTSWRFLKKSLPCYTLSVLLPASSQHSYLQSCKHQTTCYHQLVILTHLLSFSQIISVHISTKFKRIITEKNIANYLISRFRKHLTNQL